MGRNQSSWLQESSRQPNDASVVSEVKPDEWIENVGLNWWIIWPAVEQAAKNRVNEEERPADGCSGMVASNF